MKIALVQLSLIWEDPAANRSKIDSMLGSMSESVDLIILPEMFTTGFTMAPAPVAERMDGQTVSWMKSAANRHNAAVCGSVVILDNGLYRNRCLFVHPDGTTDYYDKHHLFTMAGEAEKYEAGSVKKIVSYKGWKICLQVCYDLRFPVFSRNVEDYDLLIYVANWPATRIAAWDALLKARAIENMCYVVGVNRTGDDNNNHKYPGHSKALNCFGENLAEITDAEGIFITNIERQESLDARIKLPFLTDRDTFTVN